MVFLSIALIKVLGRNGATVCVTDVISSTLPPYKSMLIAFLRPIIHLHPIIMERLCFTHVYDVKITCSISVGMADFKVEPSEMTSCVCVSSQK